jgi:hypothetical protein
MGMMINMEQQNYKAPLKLFHWNKETRTLSAEISDIQANVPELDGVGLPQFLTIFNPDTNQDRTFRYVRKETDNEGDVTAWIYESLSHTLNLTIWND